MHLSGGSNANFSAQTSSVQPSSGAADLTSLPNGLYAVLLLGTAGNVPMSYEAYQGALAQGNRMMFFTSVRTNPDGTLSPVVSFQRVTPLAVSTHYALAADTTDIRASAPPTGATNISLDPLHISASVSAAGAEPAGGGQPAGTATRPAGQRSQSPFPSVSSKPRASSTPAANTRRRSTRFASPGPPPARPNFAVDIHEPDGVRIPVKDVKSLPRSSNPLDLDRYIVWYRTAAPWTLNKPCGFNDIPPVGSIYLHTDTTTNSRQWWVLRANGNWQFVEEENQELVHPVWADRYLWIKENGTPTWVVGSTYREYYKRMVRTSGQGVKTESI